MMILVIKKYMYDIHILFYIYTFPYCNKYHDNPPLPQNKLILIQQYDIKIRRIKQILGNSVVYILCPCCVHSHEFLSTYLCQLEPLSAALLNSRWFVLNEIKNMSNPKHILNCYIIITRLSSNAIPTTELHVYIFSSNFPWLSTILIIFFSTRWHYS